MKSTTRDGILRGGIAVTIRLLMLAAAGIAAYLLSVSLSGGSAVGCSPGSSCDEVLHSRWAYVLGIPVSALALALDLALLVTTFSCGPKSKPKQRHGAWEILVPCSVLILGAALWFVALQALVLHRFCPWCMAAHTCGALAAILILTRLPITEARESRAHDPAISRPLVIRLASIAAVVLALFALAQVIVPQKTFSISNVPAAANSSTVYLTPPKTETNVSRATTASLDTNSPPLRPAMPTNPPAVARSVPKLELFGGRIQLDLTQVPILGSPEAPLKLVSLYDYTCHHCRDMHPHVTELKHLFGDKLAIVSLPMPLDSQCNALVRQTPRPQTNACLYAKLGLAVWRAKPSALAVFDDWLFNSPQPPPLSEATNKAVQLVGTIPFEAARQDPWIEQQVRTDIDIFTISMREYRNMNMPQFIIGTNIVTGTLTTEQLRAVVANYAGTGK